MACGNQSWGAQSSAGVACVPFGMEGEAFGARGFRLKLLVCQLSFFSSKLRSAWADLREHAWRRRHFGSDCTVTC